MYRQRQHQYERGNKMVAEKRLEITGENLEYVKEHFGEVADLTDEDAKVIAEDLGELERGDTVDDAWWSDDEEIVYFVNLAECDNSPDPMDIAKENKLREAYNF